eukprot:TRINITY_DN725_c2_g8_i1.p1 TRINITY_DN725_c2_g8~~TRINITY_DN725_c2_g8_i1.p1  ORF type:complete len:294 (-),score=22.30 TRINITY_DN725_c2_g8_i1:91-972(-)
MSEFRNDTWKEVTIEVFNLLSDPMHHKYERTYSIPAGKTSRLHCGAHYHVRFKLDASHLVYKNLAPRTCYIIRNDGLYSNEEVVKSSLCWRCRNPSSLLDEHDTLKQKIKRGTATDRDKEKFEVVKSTLFPEPGPRVIAIASASTLGAAAVAGTGVAVVAVPAITGFAAGGIVGGSSAAGMMSVLGTGSLSIVPVLQSVGAVGAIGAGPLAGFVFLGMAVVGGIVGGGFALHNALKFREGCWDYCLGKLDHYTGEDDVSDSDEEEEDDDDDDDVYTCNCDSSKGHSPHCKLVQ